MNQQILEQKKAMVQEIKAKIEEAQSVVLVDYRGLNVEEVTELRKKCTEAGVELKVYKNSLMKFAFKEAGYDAFEEFLVGPNAIAISKEDSVAAAKTANDFAKNHEKLEIKAGIVDGEVMDLAKISAIANLPSKEHLLTQLAVGLNASIVKFARAIQAIVDKEDAEPVAE
ncbi:MAG: 50S ribosomal protein L10 [Tissierellales bacterium]|jgi:large subunit ribosomal protein L10|nr:50S ribosomal protein L10 [Tissierellales bacterium]